MNIIISHDVDHLYTCEHWRKDLIMEKHLVRSGLQVLRGEINTRVFLYRVASVFQHRYCRIPEIMEFDTKHKIPSTFFFGMGNALGMSYTQKQALPWIQKVREAGFYAGVHAADITSAESIQKEHNDFKRICPDFTFGTRVHYVRYDNITLQRLATAGYLYDTTEFSKETFSLKQPYQIIASNGNRMWEFPLHLMDSYVLEKDVKNAIQKVSSLLRQAEQSGSLFFTFLFHDVYFNEKTYPEWIAFYKWFVSACEEAGHHFISYHQAIKMLEDAQRAAE